ncbi:hypothetical protein BH10PAT3_BH10PAT3_2980 [soil metagenome]
MPLSQPQARREVRAELPIVEGRPYDQPTKIGRFAAWVVYFKQTFPNPYEQIKDSLGSREITNFDSLSFGLHRALGDITGIKVPNRSDPNKFDTWAGALTAAVHTTSVIRSAPIVSRHFNLEADNVDVALRMLPAFSSLVMEHQDRLGDIKIGLAQQVNNNEITYGNQPINPDLLEVARNGQIRFKAEALNSIPIHKLRKNQPGRDGPFAPIHGEQIIGDIVSREEHVGCPITFIAGFTEGLLRATAETAHERELI